MIVKDIEKRGDLFLITDSQSIRAIISSIGYTEEKVEDLGLLFVQCTTDRHGINGYGEVYYAESNVPYLETPLYQIK